MASRAKIYTAWSEHDPVERIGHRGAKREFPENSIPAFRRAFELGADAIELDVHATRDGVVVVHHDPTLGSAARDRRGRAIAELDWSDVKAVDLGGGAGIPTLAEALAVTPASGAVYVEIKGLGIEERVARIISDSATRCAVHSFDRQTVSRMREVAPELPRGILIDAASSDVEAAMRAVGARDVWPEWTLINDSLVALVHACGGRVIAWTVNARAAAKKLTGMGVDGLCTDDVRLLDDL